MKSSRQLIIGYPSSGKSTYLVALWYLITEQKGNISNLILEKLDGDDEYLNSLLDKWLKCEELGRTNRTTHINIKLKDVNNGNLIDLMFPDMDGETYNQQFEERKWNTDFQDLVDKSNGSLLFINP